MKNVEKNNVVGNEVTNLGNIIIERIERNKKIFTKEEMIFIKDNSILIKKIYLLGILDSRF